MYSPPRVAIRSFDVLFPFLTLVSSITWALWISRVCTYVYVWVCCRPVPLLQQQISSVVKAIHKQLKDKSVKNRQGCFQLLTELVQVLPGALSNHVSAIVPGIQFSLGCVSQVLQPRPPPP